MNDSRARVNGHGAEYDPAALRVLMEKKGVNVRTMARRCGVGSEEVRKWLNPLPERRMQWKTMNRIRMALSLKEEEVHSVWKDMRENEGQH